jgi:hypothetical protein
MTLRIAYKHTRTDECIFTILEYSCVINGRLFVLDLLTLYNPHEICIFEFVINMVTFCEMQYNEEKSGVEYVRIL